MRVTRLVDLSVPVGPATVVYPCDPAPELTVHSTIEPVHHLIARAGGVIGENFRNLDRVDWRDPFVLSLPLRLDGADGAPVRAVAVQLSAPGCGPPAWHAAAAGGHPQRDRGRRPRGRGALRAGV